MTAQADLVFRGNATSATRAGNEAATAIVGVEKTAGRARTTLAGASKEAEGFGKSIRHLATLTIGTLGVAEAVQFLKNATQAAGDLEAAQGGVVDIFGKTPPVLAAFEKTAAKAYGVSHLAALKAANSTGQLLTNLGQSPKVAAGVSVGILKLAADIGSFNKQPTEEVVTKINRALLGQVRGLRSLGIAMSNADVDAKALAMGLVRPQKSAEGLLAATNGVTIAERKYGIAVRDHGKGSAQALSAEKSLIAANTAKQKQLDGEVPKLTALQRAQATYALLLERSKVQQGNFGKSSGDLVNQQKILGAEFHDLEERVGTGVIPIMKTLVEFMAGPGISGVSSFLDELSGDVEGVVDAVQPLAPVAHAAGAALRELNDAGVLRGLAGGIITYKALLGTVGAGQAVWSSASGLIGNLSAPFRTVGAEAGAASKLVGAGFTAQLAGTTAKASAGVGPLKALAGSATGVGAAAAIATGLLIAFASSEESIGEKARAAADDLNELQSAQDRLRGGGIDLRRDQLSQGQAARDLIKANRELKSATDDAHKSFPATVAGDRAQEQARARLTQATRNQAQAENNYDQSHQRVLADEKEIAKAREDVTKSTDKAVRKIIDLQKANENQARIAITRGVPAAKVAIEQEAKNAAALGRTTDAIKAQIKANAEIRPKSAAGFRAVLDFIKDTGKIPPSKTLKLALNDAATGKLAALKRLLDGLRDKTVTVKSITIPQTGHAAGGVIDQPQLAVVGEEAPRWPEFIIPTNPSRRGRAMGLISQMQSWIPGFADGAGPIDKLRAQEARAIASTPGKSSSSKGSGSGSSKPKDTRPAWLKQFEEHGNKLPGDDAYANAIARGEADLTDAGRTAQKADDKAALHALIKISTKRLGPLHAMRSTHKDGVWQSAVNAQISGVGGQLSGYKSSLADAVKRPGPDDITIGIPGSIKWAIERAELTGDVGAQIRAYTAKQKWLNTQLNSRDKKGKYKLQGAKATAFKREWTRTALELNSLGAQQKQAEADAAEQAAQASATAPDLPLDIQEALADASLTSDTGDDLAALGRQQKFLQDAIAVERNPTARIALKQALAGVNDQIAGIQSAAAGGSSSSGSDGGSNADQDAINAQTQRRLDVATRSASLSEAELAALRGSGDIGTGRFGNALGAGAGPAMLLTLGDARSLAALAGGVVQGIGAQASIPANRETVGIR